MMAVMNDTLSEQASRLKKLRLYLGLTRKDFEEAYGISRHTLRAWEVGEKKFTDSSVTRVVEALREKNINCSYEWFMSGMGDSPIMLKESLDYTTSVELDPVNEKSLNEIVFYKQNHPSVEIIFVCDERFEPIALPGDYIGIKKVKLGCLNKFVGSIALLDLNEEDFIWCLVKRKQDNSGFVFEPLDKRIDSISSVNNEIKILVWFKKLFSEEA